MQTTTIKHGGVTLEVTLEPDGDGEPLIEGIRATGDIGPLLSNEDFEAIQAKAAQQLRDDAAEARIVYPETIPH